MSVDIFGRQLTNIRSVSARVARGPLGEGFKITPDGQYDADHRRLCNLAAPLAENDAISLAIAQDAIREELKLAEVLTTAVQLDFDNHSAILRDIELDIDKHATASGHIIEY